MPKWVKILLAAVGGFGLTFFAKLGMVAANMSEYDTLSDITTKEWIDVVGPAATAMITTVGGYIMKSPKE